jgi:hypothetical protein
LWGGYSSGYTQTTLNDAGGISDSDTSLTLTSATDFETVATTISANVALADTTLPLADSSSFPSVGTVLIDSEKIRYSTNASNVLGGLTRGSDGTAAALHTSGATTTFVGLILIESELIQYTGKTSHTLDAGVVRGVRGTTAAAHADGVAVREANDFVSWSGASAITFSQQIRLWSQDNWGEDLFFNVYDGAPYYWDKTLGVGTRATTFASQTGASDAPTITRRIMASGADRHVVCFGCNPMSETAQDLLMIRWSDQESPFDGSKDTPGNADLDRHCPSCHALYGTALHVWYQHVGQQCVDYRNQCRHNRGRQSVLDGPGELLRLYGPYPSHPLHLVAARVRLHKPGPEC